MRGEHHPGKEAHYNNLGSSPHARGALERLHSEHLLEGLIPACAGSTVTPPTPMRRGRAHPRMRGEHGIVGALVDTAVGSSPPARGAPGVTGRAFVESGLIPACAGSTARMSA